MPTQPIHRQQEMLQAFPQLWAGAKAEPGRRLALLQRFADVMVLSDRSYESRIMEPWGYGLLGYGHCEVCGAYKSMTRHHVIQLCHGGDSARENLVAICRQCHYKVHPELELRDKQKAAAAAAARAELENERAAAVPKEPLPPLNAPRPAPAPLETPEAVAYRVLVRDLRRVLQGHEGVL